MIQTPELIPESMKVLGWIGGAGFTVWIFKMAYEMFSKTKNGRGSNSGPARASCIGSPDWTRHDLKTDLMNRSIEKLCDQLPAQTTALQIIAIQSKEQTQKLEEISQKLSLPTIRTL